MTSQLFQNGTGFKWAEGSHLSFQVSNKAALEWRPCGCAELHLGQTPFIFACDKHEDAIRQVYQKPQTGSFICIANQCRCWTINFAQGTAFTPCKEHHQAMRDVSAS